MRMMNCFCGMVDRRKVLSFISSLNHCQRFSPSEISDTLRAIFDFAQLPYLSTEIIFQLYCADLALKIHSWNSGFYTKKRVSIFWIFDQNCSWSYLVFNVFKATGLFLYILKISGKVFFGRIERDPWDEIDCVILLQIVFYIFVLSIICSKLAIETPEKGVKYVQS